MKSLSYNNKGLSTQTTSKIGLFMMKSTMSSLIHHMESRHAFSGKMIGTTRLSIATKPKIIIRSMHRFSRKLLKSGHAHNILKSINNPKTPKIYDVEIFTNNIEKTVYKSELVKNIAVAYTYHISPKDEEIFSNPIRTIVSKKQPELTFSQKVTQQSTDLTPLSNRMKYEIDNNITMQKFLCCLALETENTVNKHKLYTITMKPMISMRLSPDKTINSKTVASIDHPSNPMQACSKMMNSSMAEKMHALTDDQTYLPLLLKNIVDPCYPLTPDFTICNLQRMGHNFNISRGHVANMLYHEFCKHFPPEECDFIASVFRVENPQGIGGFDFVKETNTALHHIRDIFTKSDITLKEYRMAENNPKGSLAALESKLHTGQHNNDCTLPMLIPPTNVEIVLRVDIKHHELDRKKDITNCYVRASYKITGCHDDTPKINEYLKLVKDDLVGSIEKDDETQKIHQSLEDSQKDLKSKINDLNNYILKNAYNKPHARKTMVIFIERVISEKHSINISFIKDQDITLDSSSYDVNDKKSLKFKKNIQDLSNNPSGKAFIEHLEKKYPSPRHFNSKPLDLETHEIL